MALRLKNDGGGTWVPGLVTLDTQARQGRVGGVLAYLFRIRRAPVRCLRPQNRHASCWPCHRLATLSMRLSSPSRASAEQTA